MKMDATDWFMMGFTAVLMTAGTAYLFTFHPPSVAAYGVWAGIMTVQGGVFHGLRVLDQKIGDHCP